MYYIAKYVFAGADNYFDCVITRDILPSTRVKSSELLATRNALIDGYLLDNTLFTSQAILRAIILTFAKRTDI